MTHLIRIAAVTACIVLCTILPFLPGRYDGLAVPLSLMCQLFGKVGLFLVPVGALWFAYERRKPQEGKRRLFAIAALIASSLVWMILTIGASVESLMLGLGSIVLWICVVLRFLKSGTPGTASAIPLYLLIVPVAVALLQFVLAEPVATFSRSRAIRNSAPLIAEIERYHAANGRYPLSLISLWPDHSPSVIGIREYRYEPRGNAYNLLFEQPSFRLGTREIVVYNPRGEQVITSHALDLLQLTPEQLALEQTRGHYAVHDAPQPNWKYFWFD